MNLRPRTRRSAEINIAVTPLIDVILVLLIFFMVSTNFKDESRLRVQLPEAQGELAPAESPNMIRITIDQAGHFYVNDRALADATPQRFAQTLTATFGARQAAPDTTVLIQADASTPHQAVMTAMDAASHAGFNRIAFAATQPHQPAQ